MSKKVKCPHRQFNHSDDEKANVVADYWLTMGALGGAPRGCLPGTHGSEALWLRMSHVTMCGKWTGARRLDVRSRLTVREALALGDIPCMDGGVQRYRRLDVEGWEKIVPLARKRFNARMFPWKLVAYLQLPPVERDAWLDHCVDELLIECGHRVRPNAEQAVTGDFDDSDMAYKSHGPLEFAGVIVGSDGEHDRPLTPDTSREPKQAPTPPPHTPGNLDDYTRGEVTKFAEGMKAGMKEKSEWQSAREKEEVEVGGVLVKVAELDEWAKCRYGQPEPKRPPMGFDVVDDRGNPCSLDGNGLVVGSIKAVLVDAATELLPKVKASTLLAVIEILEEKQC